MASIKLATVDEVTAYVNPATEKKFSVMVADAVKASAIIASWAAVKVSKDASPNGKELSVKYVRLDAQNARGMAAMNNGKIEPQTQAPSEGEDTRTEQDKLIGACDHHNYGYDLGVRQSVRVWLVGEAKGPESAVKAAIKGFIAAGLPPEAVKTSPKFKDYPGIDKLVDRLISEL